MRPVARSPSRLRWSLLGALLALSFWPARALYAQAQPLTETRYTFALVGVPLAEALERLIDETSLSLVYESAFTAGRTTYCRAVHVPADALLGCILDGTGLDFVRLSSGTYVLILDPRVEPRYASVIGRVVDAETGTPLAGASVLLGGTRRGTATNVDGRFAFPMLRPGTHQLLVSHVAYHGTTDTLTLAPDEHERVAVPLRPRLVLSAPIVVSGFGAPRPSDALGTGGPLPAAGTADDEPSGTEDVVQSLESVVGVRLGDALSDVHVQGGAADEQQFLLDGVPVFMPVPNGGFIGPFSPFGVGRITVRKAGFGAAHGSGLSGVIEVEHELEIVRNRRFTAQVDPLSLNARWTGRLEPRDGIDAAWMMAFRHGLWNQFEPRRLESIVRRWATPDAFLYEALQADAPLPAEAPSNRPAGALEVGFDDVHAAFRVRFGGLRSLHGSVYRGTGAFGIDDLPSGGEAVDEDVFEDAYSWHNQTVQLRYEWVQSRRLFLNAGAWGTSYELVHPVALGDRVEGTVTSNEFNSIEERGVRLSGDFAASSRHHLAGALEAVHTASDFFLSLDPFGAAPAGPDDVHPVRWHIGAFLEDRVTLGPRLTLTGGTRLTYVPALQHLYGEPRLALRYDHAFGREAAWAARVAAGRYRQFLHAFDVATYNVTALVPRMRFWLPIGTRQRPPDAYHLTGAVLLQPRLRWQATVEVYYKHQPHLLVLDYGAGSAAAEQGEVLRSADGFAYGAAIALSYEASWIQLRVHYDYERARRRVVNRFGGRFTPVPWSAPHRFNGAVDVRPFGGWTATLRWHHLLGRSWGFRQAYYDFLEPRPDAHAYPPFDLSDPAAHRLPVLSQLDVGIAYSHAVGRLGVQGRLGIVNVFGRRNVTDWSLVLDETSGVYGRRARFSTPFLPTASLRVSL